MPMMDDQVREQVRKALAGLTRPVRIVVFTQREGGALECQFCQQTRELAEEVAARSDQVTLEVRDFEGDRDLAATYGVDKIPALVLLADGTPPRDFGIRFYGIPAGYEFSTLIEDLRLLGGGEPGLREDTRRFLDQLKRPVHLQVFVTPT